MCLLYKLTVILYKTFSTKPHVDTNSSDDESMLSDFFRKIDRVYLFERQLLQNHILL